MPDASTARQPVTREHELVGQFNPRCLRCHRTVIDLVLHPAPCRPVPVRLTDEIRQRLADLARAEARYLPGAESSAVIELPKLALADAVLAALKPRPVRATLRLPRRRRA